MTERTRAELPHTEVQLAKLLGLFEAQQERQERLERLAEDQRRRQDEIAHQQREQLDHFAKEQQQQLQELTRRQTEAEERAGVLKERLITAEATLVELATTQRMLEEELRMAGRRSEVSSGDFLSGRERPAEEAKRTATTTGLDDSAPEFGRSTSTLNSGRGPSKADGIYESAEAAPPTGGLQRPPPYDGRISWEAYRSQFDMLTTLSRWSELQKATYLAVSLRGTALTVLANLPEERRTSYSALTAALENRFGTAHQAELHRATLRSRSRRREESLPELMEDIERLVRLAYPQAEPTMLEVLAKDHFIDALADEDMRLRVRQARPETLQRAMETALELESYYLASRGRPRIVRAAGLSSEEPACASDAEILETLQQCTKALDDLVKKPLGSRGVTARRRRRTWGKSDTCWNCGEEGHYRRDCKEPECLPPDGAPPDPRDQGKGQ